LLFACRLLQPIRSSCTLYLRFELSPAPKPRVALFAWRRLSTSWMLTLRAPSFHVGAGRAFTRCVPPSGTPCHLPAPTRRLLLRPSAPAPCATLEHTRSVLPRDQNRSTVASLGGTISPVTRRWRNDSKYLPSCRDSLPASADSSGVSARQTQRLSALDRVKHRAVPVTFWHDARAPIRSDAGVTQRLCGPTSCSGHDRLTAPRYPSGLETGFRRPRQRILRFATD